MNERGLTLVEFTVSLMIISVILLSVLTMYQQLNLQSERVRDDWQVYWMTKSLIRHWQNEDIIQAGEQNKYDIEWSERIISPNILEGEFKIRWISEEYLKERKFYAYKRVEASQSY